MADRIEFSLQDNGVGFDEIMTAGINQQSYGLQGIKERVDSLAGKLVIKSNSLANIGTMFMISIPLNQVDKKFK